MGKLLSPSRNGRRRSSVGRCCPSERGMEAKELDCETWLRISLQRPTPPLLSQSPSPCVGTSLLPSSPLLLIIWIWRNVRPNVVTTHYQIATHANRAIGGHGRTLGSSFILATLSFSSYAQGWSWRRQPCLPSLLSPAKLSPPFRAFTEGFKEGEEWRRGKRFRV